MKAQILQLKEEGKTYREIQEITGASKGVISYHCNPEVKRKSIEQQNIRRKLYKQRLIGYKGGKCSICGYDKCVAALEFHHIDSSLKEFEISYGNKSYERLKTEADKCILICSNCHRELHHLEGEAVTLE